MANDRWQDNQQLFNNFTEFMNEHGIVLSNPNSVIIGLGSLMGQCAKVLDEVRGTTDALHAIHEASKQAYDKAVYKG